MAVVLVADVMPHKSLSDALTMTQWTPTAIWEYEKDPKVTFGRKFQTNALQRKPDETYLFKAFEVHILPPGKYLLTGGDDYQIHGLLDQVGARSGPPGSGHGANGTAYLSPSCIASTTGKKSGKMPPMAARSRPRRSAPPCMWPRAPA